MKKIIKELMVSFSLMVFVYACGTSAVQNNSATNTEQPSNVIEASKVPESVSSETVQSTSSISNSVEAKSDISNEKIELVKEFTTKQNNLSKYTYHIIVVKNNNDVPVKIRSNSNAFDANKNLIGAKSATLEILGSGETSVVVEAFEEIDSVDYFETTLSASESLYNEIDSIIEMDLNSSSNKVFVTLNNIGNDPAMFMKAHVIFMDNDGNAINYNYKFINGSDSEIKPGESITEEIKCTSDFSTAEVYFEGRRKK